MYIQKKGKGETKVQRERKNYKVIEQMRQNINI